MKPPEQPTKSIHDASIRLGTQGVRMVVVGGSDHGLQVALEQGTGLIGTGSGCDLRLTDETVSRQHVAVEVLKRRVRVKDLNSKNGTLYLGARIDTADLPIGATIQVGQTRIALLPVQLAPDALSPKTELCDMRGASPAMRRLFAQMEQVGPTDVPVLIRGESGVGKDMVARALHQLSDRRDGPFQVLDCSSLSPTLVHAALFGHNKGAFTGAQKDTPGVLELTNGGTLFLDELGELPLEIQPLLLRSLETHEFTRMGESEVRKSDFRLICATHLDLEAEVKAGRFRLDLYHRLPSIALTVPPLRDRVEDIPMLVQHFLAQRGGPQLSSAEVAVLSAHSWPGNVRELRNSVERMAALVGTNTLQPAGATPTNTFQEVREKVIRTFERAYLEGLLEKHQKNAVAAAQEAGLAKSYFYKLLALHGLTPRRTK